MAQEEGRSAGLYVGKELCATGCPATRRPGHGSGRSHVFLRSGVGDDSSPAYNVLNAEVTEIQSDTYTYKLASWICLSSAYLCND